MLELPILPEPDVAEDRRTSPATSTASLALPHAIQAAAQAATTDDIAAYASALAQCGEARLQLGDITGAYEDFREVARLEPTNFEAWQKYEETYRAAEHLLTEEHAKITASTDRQTPQDGGLLGIARNSTLEGSGPTSRSRGPPRFTFVEPVDVDSDQDSSNDECDEETISSASFILDGVGGGLGQGFALFSNVGAPTSRSPGGAATGSKGASALERRRSTQAVSRGGRRTTVVQGQPAVGNSRGSVVSASPSRKTSFVGTQGISTHPLAGDIGRDERVELMVPSSQIFHFTLLIWLLTGILVIYYYTFHRGKNFEGLTGTFLALITFISLIQCSRRKCYFIVSKTDLKKILCVLIVIVCTIHHYWKSFSTRHDRKTDQISRD